MKSIQGTPVGMGSVVPGMREVTDRRPYRHQGRPAGWPFDPDTHDPDPGTAAVQSFARSSSERHRYQLTRYEALIKAEPDLTHVQAARRMGLAPRTIRGYAKELADRAGTAGEAAGS